MEKENYEKFKFKLTFEKFFKEIVNNTDFRKHIIDIFSESKFDQIFWEFPPYNSRTHNNLAEFVFVKAPKFNLSNSESFLEYFQNKNEGDVIIFKNLSKDTDLITVVSHNGRNNVYSDIMKFMRDGNNNIKHDLLKTIGNEMLKHTKSHENIYLSTHGFGVPWLHIRIGKFPKYYSLVEYL